MLRPVMRKVEVTGDGVRRGDIVEVGGLLHQVRDVRELRGRRKRLEFEDGNTYVLGPSVPITVAREYAARGYAHPPPGTSSREDATPLTESRRIAEEIRRHRANTTLQDDFG